MILPIPPQDPPIDWHLAITEVPAMPPPLVQSYGPPDQHQIAEIGKRLDAIEAKLAAIGTKLDRLLDAGQRSGLVVTSGVYGQ